MFSTVSVELVISRPRRAASSWSSRGGECCWASSNDSMFLEKNTRMCGYCLRIFFVKVLRFILRKKVQSDDRKVLFSKFERAGLDPGARVRSFFAGIG